MSEALFSNNLLKLFTNKNNSIFRSACQQMYPNIKGKVGFIYDDFDYNQKLIESWTPYNLDKLFINAKRRKTISMDDKILFHKKMSMSQFTPESYLSIDKITDKESLYFVKKTGSTGGLGVNIYNYDTLKTVNTNGCVIQKNISNPDLYNYKRYKIRQLILIYNEKVYIFKTSWFSCSNIDYNSDDNKYNEFKDKHVISQRSNTIFDLCDKLENFDLIYENIKLSLEDFKIYYKTEIENIKGNEYAILGVDIIVDDNKNVHIIEINHRSNYAHPKNVSEICDVNFFKAVLNLLIFDDKSQLQEI